MQRGRLDEAAAAIEALKRRNEGIADVWALDGEIAIRQRRMSDAVTAVDRAAALEPDIADRHIQRARCYVIAGNIDEAKVSVLRALQYDVDRLDHLLVLGGVLVRCDEHEKALGIYEAAQRAAPDNADVYRGLASVYRFLGRSNDAETACDRALELDASDYESAGMRSSLRKQTPENNHVEDLLAMAQSGFRSWRGEVHVCYALAKEYEVLGAYELSFSWLSRGAQRKRQHTRYDLADDVGIFAALKDAFTADVIASYRGRGHDSDEPIFVLGMPRTGSTLVERIISSHSQVQSAGELSTFSIEMVRMVNERNQAVDRLALPAHAAVLPMRELGQRYLDGVAPARDGSPRFVDKLPLNSLNIGLIHGALPNAKIVHVMRNPMDACYAIYKYLFKHGYPFSYDLTELATYYGHYADLMDHWRELLPNGRIYHIRYEQLVDDLPGEARRLIDHLELGWEQDCEDFHTTEHATTTGSASQVRQPVYRSSIGKWRRYEKQLEPLAEALAARGLTDD